MLELGEFPADMIHWICISWRNPGPLSTALAQYLINTGLGCHVYWGNFTHTVGMRSISSGCNFFIQVAKKSGQTLGHVSLIICASTQLTFIRCRFGCPLSFRVSSTVMLFWLAVVTTLRLFWLAVVTLRLFWLAVVTLKLFWLALVLTVNVSALLLAGDKLLWFRRRSLTLNYNNAQYL